MKRVGINAIVLNPQSGGLGVYLDKLIDYLVREPHGFEPVIFLSAHYEMPESWRESGLIRTVKIANDRPITRILSEPFFWPGMIRECGIDLFHSPISYIPFGVRIPTVVTIHDLRSFHNPQAYTWLRRRFLERMISHSAVRAQRILTISEFTRQDIVETLGVPGERIKVIYEGLDQARFRRNYSATEFSAIRQKYKLPGKYILTVGHLEPRKNYPRLLEAFHLLQREKQIEHGLVIVGRENWAFQDIYDAVNRLQLHDVVRFTKFVEESDLPALYQMADAFVAPSLFEGFGFTPLESMVTGTPVAAANTTAYPEVCGNAALYFDPYSIEEIAKAISRLILDNQLRNDLVQRGYENVNRFDWQQSCRQIADEYEGLLAQI